MSVLLAAHYVAMFGSAFAIVDRGDGSSRVAKRGVRSNVLDKLAAYIDPPTVADAFQVVFAAHQHRSLLTGICLSLDDAKHEGGALWGGLGLSLRFLDFPLPHGAVT